MSVSIPQSIDALCKERGIDRELVIEAMKEAVLAAARRQFKAGDRERGMNLSVEWDSETGLAVFALKEVVGEVYNEAREISLAEAQELAGDGVEIGDELQIPLPLEEMGRIAAQTAKQILMQKVRDAERANIYEQYVDRIGDIVNGFVKRFERGDIIVDLGGNIEAILPRKEQSRHEQWNQGERIRAVISDVLREAKGPQIELSRTSPELLKRLFEMEVPEIYDETVVIKSAVREPGERAKIAVASNERDVDPVGACVGMKGSRVQAIIKELRGEKIDIIEWSDEPSVFAANALSPAKVNQVRITDIERRQMEVIVNEDQLSLAIGKRGQNVRLATKLVQWNIDIRSEEEVKREVAAQMGAMIAAGEHVPLTALSSITPAFAAELAAREVKDVESLAAISVDDLADHLDVSLDQAQAIHDEAATIVGAGKQGGETMKDQATEQTTAERIDIKEQHAASVEPDPTSNAELEPSEAMIAEGYDEAVRAGEPYRTEVDENILAEEESQPVALTEADQMTAGELALQDAGRDLRADAITPSPDITSTGAAIADAQERRAEMNEPVREEDAPFAPFISDSEARAPETTVSSRPDATSETALAAEQTGATQNVAEETTGDVSSNAHK
jgi:N utilization substance protein A